MLSNWRGGWEAEIAGIRPGNVQSGLSLLTFLPQLGMAVHRHTYDPSYSSGKSRKTV